MIVEFIGGGPWDGVELDIESIALNPGEEYRINTLTPYAITKLSGSYFYRGFGQMWWEPEQP